MTDADAKGIERRLALLERQVAELLNPPKTREDIKRLAQAILSGQRRIGVGRRRTREG